MIEMYLKSFKNYLFWLYYCLSQSTESPATGHVYGSIDRWIGLGLFFDSFDNDNKHNNPYIMAMTNDGTKNFDHQVKML